jgi:predicted Zn-dependent protease
MRQNRLAFFTGILAAMAVLVQCNKDDRSINFFTLNQDIAFGASMDTMILDDPAQFSVLERSEYLTAYQHLERIRDKLLATGLVAYDDRFPWVVRLIHNDTTLNAFAAPGGYMYFYTGIIRFLDDEAEFAGVMAHCARRHSTDNLTKQYGFSIMLGIILGDNPGQLAEIAAGLASGLSSLAFSRQNEYEADRYAVKYLSATDYDPRGLAGFFEKMEGHPVTPTFLSTHPSPEDRIEQIYANWELEGSKEGQRFESKYTDFKSSLPAVQD